MNQRRLDEIDEVLDEMTEMDDEWIIVVEGLRDKRALEHLGICRDVMMVQSEGGPLRISERIHERNGKAVILTDWDGKGEEIAKTLKRHLCALDVPYDTSMRQRLKDLSIKDIKDVESLDSLWNRLAAESR